MLPNFTSLIRRLDTICTATARSTDQETSRSQLFRDKLCLDPLQASARESVDQTESHASRLGHDHVVQHNLPTCDSRNRQCTRNIVWLSHEPSEQSIKETERTTSDEQSQNVGRDKSTLAFETLDQGDFEQDVSGGLEDRRHIRQRHRRPQES